MIYIRKGPYHNKVREYRKISGVTQTGLAERLRRRGFRASGAYISQIEAGLKHIPYGLAVAICEELGLESHQVTEIFLPEHFTIGLEENNGVDKDNLGK